MYYALPNQAVTFRAIAVLIAIVFGGMFSSDAVAHEGNYPTSVYEAGIADYKILSWSYDCDSADPTIDTAKGEQIQLDTSDFTVAQDRPAEGDACLSGEVTGLNQACFLEIPFKAIKGRAVRLSFHLRGDGKTRCAVWAGVGEKGRAIVSLNGISRQWTQINANFVPQKDGQGQLQIVTPSSHGAPAGKAWIDDIRFYEMQPEPNIPDAYQDEPVLAADPDGNVFLAVVDRSEEHPHVPVYRIDDDDRTLLTEFEVEGATGIGIPELCATADSLYLAVSVERNDRWEIAIVRISGAANSEKKPAVAAPIYLVAPQATINRRPALATSAGEVYIAWEADAVDARAVYVAKITEGKVVEDSIQRVSQESINANNPDIAILEDGRVICVYDAIDREGADLFAVFCSDDSSRMYKPMRITNDPRIERYASITTKGNEIWIAWQAQSYGTTLGRPVRPDPNNILRAVRVNNMNEQRIVAALLKESSDGDEFDLKVPSGMFEKVSTAGRLLLRPQLDFDRSGRLWLTARLSTGPHTGWAPVAWTYQGDAWSEMQTLHYNVGRYRPLHPVTGKDGLIVACQTDNLPNGWGPTRGIHPGWLSAVVIRNLTKYNDRDISVSSNQHNLLETLIMPETTFSLPERWDYLNLDLPRQTRTIDGKKLMLLFGDFHDHSDMSVCARATNPPVDDLYANERDIEQIDFLAITDHGYNLDRQQWQWSAEHARQAHQPERFVTFLAEEWTSSKNPPAIAGEPNRYGHHNLIFLDPYHKRFYDSFDGDISPRELWDQMEGVEFLCVPHQLADWKGKGGGNPPTDWNFVDEYLQPVAEIYQARQSYEYLGCPRQAPEGAPFKGYYLQDAWAKGVIIGVIASPDHGGGCGKIGAWAEEFTRDGIFEAVRARRTFGTSHPKMSLLFRTDDNHLMGEVVIRDNLVAAKATDGDRSLSFNVEAITPRPVKEVVIFRNNQIVYKASPDSTKIDIDWTDENPPGEARLWYYARVECTDGELAWSSPIWFMSKEERVKSISQQR